MTALDLDMPRWQQPLNVTAGGEIGIGCRECGVLVPWVLVETHNDKHADAANG